MKFARTLTLFTLLVLFLTGALILTHILRPKAPLLKGDRLFPVTAEAVIAIDWEVTLPSGERIPLTLQRSGEFWRMQSPYAEALCDTAAVTKLLDTCQSLRVQSRLAPEQNESFTPDRTLTLKTSDTTFRCTFGPVAPMLLSNTLVHTGNEVVSVNAEPLTSLPQNADELRTHAVLPFAPERILSIEWRTPGRPFARALRMDNGNWNVTRPFAFEAKAAEVNPLLELLTANTVVTDYILPVTPTVARGDIPAAPTRITSEVELARYGLDEENATRISVYLRGYSDAWTLRLGHADPDRPNNIFALLDNYQAIVSVPNTLQTLFAQPGPLATDFNDLPLFADFATRVQTLTLHHFSPEATLRLSRTKGAWQLLAPMNLPADTARVEALMADLTALTGNLIGAEEPEGLPLVYELTLLPIGEHPTPTNVNIYRAGPSELYVYRADLARLYSIADPELFRIGLERELVDRTIFSLPAGTIQRIAVETREGATQAVVRSDGLTPELPWRTESPRGAYILQENVDQWLVRFADLKATRILRDIPTGPNALVPYGLNKPFLSITLDLRGETDDLRRILLIGTPHATSGNAPALIQGRPILYEIDAETLKLLRQPLVQ